MAGQRREELQRHLWWGLRCCSRSDLPGGRRRWAAARAAAGRGVRVSARRVTEELVEEMVKVVGGESRGKRWLHGGDSRAWVDSGSEELRGQRWRGMRRGGLQQGRRQCRWFSAWVRAEDVLVAELGYSWRRAWLSSGRRDARGEAGLVGGVSGKLETAVGCGGGAGEVGLEQLRRSTDGGELS